jgi:ribosomal 50S subunit-recycling heat shock protein
MRLDKYLKVSRLIKRRTIANDACDSERITVNGKVPKASYNVKIGDEITVAFGTKSVTVRVLDIRDTTKKTEAVGMYEVVSETNS